MCLHIPLDWWPRRKGAGHVPPPAFEQTMVQSRCGILLCIWRPNWVDASGLRTNVHHAGEQKARKALWVLLASETGVLNHRSRPCSCTPSSSCREQVDVGLAALHGAHGKRGRRRSGRCRLAPHGPGRAGKRERGCCWRQGCGTRP